MPSFKCPGSSFFFLFICRAAVRKKLFCSFWFPDLLCVMSSLKEVWNVRNRHAVLLAGRAANTQSQPCSVIRLAPAVQNRCSSPARAAWKSLRQAAILGKLVKTTVAPPGWCCHAEVQCKATEWKTQTQPGQRGPAGVCHLEALQPTGGCCGRLLPMHLIQVISHSARARRRRGKSLTETGIMKTGQLLRHYFCTFLIFLLLSMSLTAQWVDLYFYFLQLGKYCYS